MILWPSLLKTGACRDWVKLVILQENRQVNISTVMIPQKFSKTLTQMLPLCCQATCILHPVQQLVGDKALTLVSENQVFWTYLFLRGTYFHC